MNQNVTTLLLISYGCIELKCQAWVMTWTRIGAWWKKYSTRFSATANVIASKCKHKLWYLRTPFKCKWREPTRRFVWRSSPPEIYNWCALDIVIVAINYLAGPGWKSHWPITLQNGNGFCLLLCAARAPRAARWTTDYSSTVPGPYIINVILFIRRPTSVK